MKDKKHMDVKQDKKLVQKMIKDDNKKDVKVMKKMCKPKSK